MRKLKSISGLILVAALCAAMCASKPDKPEKEKDKYVRLMSAQSVSTMVKDGRDFRMAEGPARFLHNDTWLICDTALWDVDKQVIYAMGNVSIEQDETELRSDKLTYYIETDIAEFRGSLVELIDKDNNILRTRHLDYNTKDSVATFHFGAAMRDKDGQIIESRDGSYESKVKLFTFENEVDMFSDSVFVKTSKLLYESDQSLATFPNYVDAWNEDRMMSGNRGSYNNSSEIFFMTGNVHCMDTNNEMWCDSLYFYKKLKSLQLMGNAQISDSSRASTGLSGRMYYRDSLSFAKMWDDPLLITLTEEEDKEGKVQKDSLFMRADTLYTWKLMRFQLDSAEVENAKTRIQDLSSDPIANIRAKAAEEAERRRREEEGFEDQGGASAAPEKQKEQKGGAKKPEMKEDKKPQDKKAAEKKVEDKKPEMKADAQKPEARKPDLAAGPAALGGRRELPSKPDSLGVADSLMRPKALKDSLALSDSRTITDSLALPDSLALADSLAITDSLANLGPKYTAEDSVEFNHIRAVGKVKMWRKDMQVVCDSLMYTDLDSLARLYKSPVVWNGKDHQYSADSIFVATRDGSLDRANLLSNAFIFIEEEKDKFYNQIKATEMTAFFDEKGQLKRFDALGGANAIFFMREKEDVSLANRSEATMFTANFVDGELSSISYYENPKSSAYPVAQMRADDKTLKGASWIPASRPSGRKELSSRMERRSEKAGYSKHPRARYLQTGIYFPGYMDNIYRQIAIADSLEQVNKLRQKEREEAERLQRLDSLAGPDSLRRDSLQLDSLGRDSLKLDSLGLDGLKLDSLGRDSLNLDKLSLDALKSGSMKRDSLGRDSLGRELAAKAESDSLALAVPDSLAVGLDTLAAAKSAKELEREAKEAARQARKAELQAKREAKQAALEAKWAEQDARDALKEAEKLAKKKAREKKKIEKQIKRLEKEKEREDALIEKLRRKFSKKVAKKFAV